MHRLLWIDLLLWCATAGLTAANLLQPDDGRWGRAAIVFALGGMTLALVWVVLRECRESRETFERTLGKAYELGHRAERRESESRHLTAVQVLERT